MNNMYSLSITIPAYNEEGSIERVAQQALKAGRAFSKNFEVLLVDDGSTDTTGVIIDRLATKHKEIRVIHHKKNQGFSGAIKTCYRNARKELVFLAPADGQVDIADYKRFLDKIMTPISEASDKIHSNAQMAGWLDGWMDKKKPSDHITIRPFSFPDVVVGYRLNSPEGWSRKVNSFLFHSLYRFLFAIPLREISTCILWRKKVLDSIEITASPRSAMIEPEIIYRAWKKGFAFRQVGIPYYPRTRGRAKGANPLMILETLKEMLRLFWQVRVQG